MRSVFTFLGDEKAAVTIEFVLWVPIFIGLFVLCSGGTDPLLTADYYRLVR